MIKFDKDGFFVGQVINIEVDHTNDYGFFESKKEVIFDKTKYIAYKHITLQKDAIEELVPLYKTTYKGEKFAEFNNKDSGALAIVFRSSKSKKLVIAKILIPK